MDIGSERVPAISALIVAADMPPPVPDRSLPSPLNDMVVQSQFALLEKSRTMATSPTNVVPSQATKLEQLDTKRRSVSRARVDGEYFRNSFGRDAVQSQVTKLQGIESHKRAVSTSPPPPPSGSGSLTLTSGITTRNSTRVERSSADIASPISPSEQSEEQVEELRMRNEMLVREIARLSELQAPPAYELMMDYDIYF
ncbi:hypothetical protein BDZ89DRAFT_1145092 [Hymenopellis radicata]|nr:hypothetical protein BDZ89DRAFT_1145092 [Hymenopellis radicata]